MKHSEIPDYSNAPCKSLVVENIRAVEKGKPLTAPLRILNKSCEFKTAYKRIVGEFEKQDEEEKKAYKKAYRKTDKYKAYLKAYYIRKKLEKDKN